MHDDDANCNYLFALTFPLAIPRYINVQLIHWLAIIIAECLSTSVTRLTCANVKKMLKSRKFHLDIFIFQ